VYIFDTKVLHELEGNGYSLNETLGAEKSISRTAIFLNLIWLIEFRGNPGQDSSSMTPKTDQLPDEIP